MSCLQKYWVKEFAMFFALIQTIILVLFVFIDYLSRTDKFLNSDLTLIGGLGYVLLKVPYMFVQLTPASILLATLVVFGLMNRNNELLILKASGISDYYLFKPALMVSVLLLLTIFVVGETIIPVTMSKANYIRYYVMKNRTNISSSRKDIWIKSDRKMIHINFFNAAKKSVAGVTITSMDKDFNLQTRIDAKRGYFKEDEWHFKNILKQVYSKKLDDFIVSSIDHEKIKIDIKPDDLMDVTKKTNEMSFFELKNYASKVRKEGYDATGYETDMYGKLAQPFICVIMALVGAVSGMGSIARRNMPAAIAIGVVIAFVYWFSFGFCLSLGYGGILPPFVSAWITNFLFLLLGTIYAINRYQV